MALHPLKKAMMLAVLAVLTLNFGSVARAQIGPGYAAAFDGISGYVDVPPVAGLSPGNTAHTIEAWVLVGALPPSGARAWLLVLGYDGPAHQWVLNSDGTCAM